jgi:hypothetical protein
VLQKVRKEGFLVQNLKIRLPDAAPSGAWHANPGAVFDAPADETYWTWMTNGSPTGHHPCLQPLQPL